MLKNTTHTDNTFSPRHLDKYLKEKGLTRITLKEFSVPDGVTKIGQDAFYNCTSLSSIEFPGSLNEIGLSAFRGCTSLSSIEFSAGVSNIGQEAFSRCTSLTHIEFSESLSEIELHAFKDCSRLQYIVTNQNFDWFHLVIDTSKVQILSYLQYLAQKKPSLLEELDTHNLEPHRAYQIYKMLNDKDYLPTWDTLKDTFQNRSTTQLRSLLQKLGKDMRAVDDVIPSIGITINNCPLHDSIFSYMSIKDCDAIFDGSKSLNFIWQTEIKDPKDDLSEIESEQNSVESYNSTTKTHIN